MVSELRKQSMAWMEHGLRISLNRCGFFMEDKMVAGGFGQIMSETAISRICLFLFLFLLLLLLFVDLHVRSQ